jgi:hypothetical protein
MKTIFVCRINRYFGHNRKVGIEYIHNSRESYLEIGLYNKCLQVGRVLKED